MVYGHLQVELHEDSIDVWTRPRLDGPGGVGAVEDVGEDIRISVDGAGGSGVVVEWVCDGVVCEGVNFVAAVLNSASVSVS